MLKFKAICNLVRTEATICLTMSPTLNGVLNGGCGALTHQKRQALEEKVHPEMLYPSS